LIITYYFVLINIIIKVFRKYNILIKKDFYTMIEKII